MNRNTRTFVILGIIVLAVVLIFWSRSARDKAVLVPLPADSVAAMEGERVPGAPTDETVPEGQDQTATGSNATTRTSLCDDLVLTDSIGERPVEDRRTKGVAIYEGDPERHRRVARNVGGDSSYWVWTLPGSRAGYWIECSYEGDRVRTRRLPDSVSECTVALEGSSKSPLIRGVACS
jgi:hypothetical protein